MCDAQTTTNSPVLLSMLSFVLGFVTAVCAEPARQRLFRPVLELNFANTPDCVTKTRTTGGHQAIYVRLRVENKKSRLAKQCRAYLIKIEIKNNDGEFESTMYTDSIQLAWSCREPGMERAPLDLPNGVLQYIDVVATDQASNSFAPQISPFPLRYKTAT